MALYSHVLLHCLIWLTASSVSCTGSWSTVPGTGASPNVVCIAEHCHSQALDCTEDPDCRHNIECIVKCASNASCINTCMNTFENPAYDAMVQCMVYDHHCFIPEPADPTFRCSPPKTFVKNFTLSQLNGTWYVVRALSRDLGCLDCHMSVYAPSKVSQNYTVDEMYSVRLTNGSWRRRVLEQQVAQRDPHNGGLLDYTNHMMGLTLYEKWHVLDYPSDGRFVVFYFCGHVNSHWWYEGSLVYSRSQVLAPRDVARVADAVKSTTGHTLDQFCTPSREHCS